MGCVACALVLNTQSFLDSEVINMAKELQDKFQFNTETRTNKGKKIIVIKSDSFDLFYSTISPYIIPEMQYKLP